MTNTHNRLTEGTAVETNRVQEIKNDWTIIRDYIYNRPTLIQSLRIADRISEVDTVRSIARGIAKKAAEEDKKITKENISDFHGLIVDACVHYRSLLQNMGNIYHEKIEDLLSMASNSAKDVYDKWERTANREKQKRIAEMN